MSSVCAAPGQAPAPIELVAVGLAVLYLLLAIRQNIWCWACAGASTAIYVWLFIDAGLYMESLLNVFYFAMAIYGFSVWYRGGPGNLGLPVVRWPPATHALAVAAILAASAASGWLLDRHTDACYPYVDSMTTWGAIWATFLVARKVLENWWYWLLIDAASIVIYWSRNLEFTALLFAVYVVLIPIGWWRWSKSMDERPA